MVDHLVCTLPVLRLESDPNSAACFLTYDYPEAKDLLKSILTLISGVLVVSVTFGEKVVGLRGARPVARRFLVAAWVGLVLAFITAGLALALIAIAAGDMVYGTPVHFFPVHPYDLEFACWMSVFASGALFVASLAAMVTSAVISMRAPAPESQPPA